MRPLTIAQKNAIISKIKTKITEAENKRYEDFKKNYKFTSKEDKALISAIENFNFSLRNLTEVIKELKKWNIEKPISASLFEEGAAKKLIVDNAFSKMARPAYPNLEDIATDLEILSIDSTFDVKAFIAKYTKF